MANTTVVSIGWIVLLSGLTALGFTIYALVYGPGNTFVTSWMTNCGDTPGRGCTDPVHSSLSALMNVSYSSAYGTMALSIGMCLVGVSLIMTGSSVSMMGGRR